MELHPSYDPQADEWYVEHEGSELSAPSLAELKAQFPQDIDFVGYHPNGYVAQRPGFLEPSDRKGLVIWKRSPTLTPAKPKVVVEVKPEPVVVPEPIKVEVQPIERVRYKLPEPNPKGGKSFIYSHEQILDKVAEGLPVVKVAKQIGCSIETVAKVKRQARAKGDPRGFIKPQYRIKTGYIHPNGERYKGWTDEDDAQLKYLAEVRKLTSGQIGIKMGVSKNSIIGRCHRKKIQLQHANCTSPQFHKNRQQYGRPKNEVDTQGSQSLQSKALDKGMQGSRTDVHGEPDSSSHPLREPLAKAVRG